MTWIQWMGFAVGERAGTGETELGDSIAGDDETRAALTLPQAASSTAAPTNTATLDHWIAQVH